MHKQISRLALMAGASIALSSQASAQNSAPDSEQNSGQSSAWDTALTDIIVTGRRAAADQDIIDPVTNPVPLPDAANLAARAPGAAIIDNGPLSGQVQYHGMAGDRILIRVNGQHFTSGGPNLMDPPLHYAPMILLDSIELDRSVGPVRHGPSLGGSFNAILKTPEFGSAGQLTPQADIGASWHSANAGYALGGMVGLANDSFRIGLIAAQEQGEDMQFPGGTASSTSYERLNFGATIGHRRGEHEITLEYRRQQTNPSGNAPFSMDIIYVDTDFVRGAYSGPIADDVRIEASATHTAVRHLMDNNTLRTPPADMMAYRQNHTSGDTYNAGLALIFGSPANHIRLGGDYEETIKNARISNPGNAGFSITALNDVTSQRIGGHVEWRGQLGGLHSEIGTRFDHHQMAADIADIGPAVPMMARNLGIAFGAADRDWSGNSLDVVARFWGEGGQIQPRLTLAHKTRAPGAVERFSWLPTEASGGLADMNIYVGDPHLRTEKAWIAEIGFDWASSGAYVRPTVFYRQIDDYIQGVPYDQTIGVIDSAVEMVANMNGDATPLRFGNVDGRIYGADVDFGFQLAGPLRVDGVASYVRANRRDIDDNLYRIAPPNIRATLAWETGRWSLGLEGVAFASQSKVSAANNEQPTDGFFIANVMGSVNIGKALRLSAGVENLFNREYVEHLAGYNRVTDSDVALGARLPGAGRSAFVRLGFTL